jgi:hypothetical protein
MPRPTDAPTASPIAALAAALALALGVSGCELTSVELADVVDVVVAEVYLRPGEEVHRALLHRTVPGPGGSVSVEGATIVVTGERGETLVFERATEADACVDRSIGLELDASCYIAYDEGRVIPGASYDLDIALPDGRRLAGRTTVPGVFELVAPAPRTCVVGDSPLTFVWTRSTGAWAYQLDALITGLAEGLAERGVTAPPDTLMLLGLAVGVNDTTIVFPDEFGVFDRFQVDLAVLLALRDGLPAGSRADIALAAGDRNYVNWVRGGNFNPSGPVRISSITGDGIGVFAALVTHRRMLFPAGPEAEEGGWPDC